MLQSAGRIFHDGTGQRKSAGLPRSRYGSRRRLWQPKRMLGARGSRSFRKLGQARLDENPPRRRNMQAARCESQCRRTRCSFGAVRAWRGGAPESLRTNAARCLGVRRSDQHERSPRDPSLGVKKLKELSPWRRQARQAVFSWAARAAAHISAERFTYVKLKAFTSVQSSQTRARGPRRASYSIVGSLRDAARQDGKLRRLAVTRRREVAPA